MLIILTAKIINKRFVGDYVHLPSQKALTSYASLISVNSRVSLRYILNLKI
jgi:hypothetical protein